MATPGNPVTIDENALTIFTDGSMYPGPRRGGLAFLIVVTGPDGYPLTFEEPLQGYKGATSQQMELMACIEALLYVAGRYSPVDPADYSRIQIFTDSTYVANNFRNAFDAWPGSGWMTRAGNPVENAKLWKELVKARQKAHRRVDIDWRKGHSKLNPYNKQVDKLAKKSAKGALREPITPIRVGRKRTTKKTEICSIPAEGQRLNIHVIVDQYLPVPKMFKYKIEAIGKGNPYLGNVDEFYSERDLMLSARHDYCVRLNNDPNKRRIEALFRELTPRSRKSA
jgi:ribonuclease HI